MIKIPQFLIEFTGDLYIHKYPLWFVYKPHMHLVKGFEIRQILNRLEPGDILIRSFKGYLDEMFIPGEWSHAGLYVGDNTAIHIMGEGIIQEDILDFFRCDSIAIMRLKDRQDKNNILKRAIKLAWKFVDENTTYDFDFTQGNSKLYCSELVDSCYDGLFKNDYKQILDRKILSPNDVYMSDNVINIIEFKH